MCDFIKDSHRFKLPVLVFIIFNASVSVPRRNRPRSLFIKNDCAIAAPRTSLVGWFMLNRYCLCSVVFTL